MQATGMAILSVSIVIDSSFKGLLMAMGTSLPATRSSFAGHHRF
jgi:hypothetical protein